MSWISVKDRLPEPDQSVLLFLDDALALHPIRIGKRDPLGEKFPECFWCFSTGVYLYGSREEGFTHWMPLPEPPKETVANP